MTEDAAAHPPDLATTSHHRCPGCDAVYPGPLVRRGRSNASESCWQTYGEVASYELANLATLGRLHQLMVDTYGAQHAGGGAASRLVVAFALIGLGLTLDQGWTGTEVRDAHRYLAADRREWPEFTAPARRGAITVVDVALADSPEAHADLVTRWAREVWATWSAAHDEVAALVAQRLPSDVQRRLRDGP